MRPRLIPLLSVLPIAATCASHYGGSAFAWIGLSGRVGIRRDARQRIAALLGLPMTVSGPFGRIVFCSIGFLLVRW